MTVISHDAFLAALKRFAVPVVGHTRIGLPWYRHNAGATFDAHVLGVHDTRHGGTSDLWPIERAWTFCWDGRSDVPGPLYLGLISREAGHEALHMIGWGKTNNAGKTNKAALDRAWRGQMPYDRELNSPATDNYAAANNVVAGFAYVCNGQPTPAQVRVMEGTLAAYIFACKWTGDTGPQSIADHEELTGRKTDSTRDAHLTRQGVKARLANPIPAPAPASAVAAVSVAGKVPVLEAGMRDPTGFGGNYVTRVQLLLGVPKTGVYDPATEAAVADMNERLIGRTVDGKTIDAPTWDRLYGLI